MKSKRIESYFLSVIRRQRNGFIPSVLRFFLLIVSWFFQLFSICRNWTFDHGWLRRYSPPVPLVISIGNIVIGGTGKTPVTLMLAKAFYGSFPIAILSRGYRSEAERRSQPTCLCSARGLLYPASYCGDEPFLLAQNLPKAYVFVGKNRHKTSIMAAKAGAKLILLDDGMQHRRLSRDLDVVVMDSRDLFGQGYFIPRGFLRESPSSLARAHLIVLNHIETTEQFVEAKAQIEKFSFAPVVGARMHVTHIYTFKEEVIPSIENKSVGIFCGIAHPEYFEQTVIGQGAQIIDRYIVPDHRDFDPFVLESFAKRCKEQGAEILLCTEKDRVRFLDNFSLSLPVAWLQIELSIVEGNEIWEEFIEQAKRDMLRHM